MRILLLNLLLIGHAQAAQAQLLTADSAVARTLARHPSLSAAELKLRQQQALRPAAYALPRTELQLEAPSGEFYTPGILQSFAWPGLYASQARQQAAAVGLARAEQDLTRNGIVAATRLLHLQWVHAHARALLLARQDSAMQAFVQAMQLRQRVGQIRPLELLNAEAQQRSLALQLQQNRALTTSLWAQLQLLTGLATAQPPALQPSETTTLPDSADTNLNPLYALLEQQRARSAAEWRTERNSLLPGFQLGYMNQGPTPATPLRYNFRFGITVPLFAWGAGARVRAAKLGYQMTERWVQAQDQQLRQNYLAAQGQLAQAQAALSYYSSSALGQAASLMDAAQKSYRLGDTDLVLYLHSMARAFDLQAGYLDAVYHYNQALIHLHHVQGKP